jgi:xanthine dehydrogenase accessory factor
MRELLNELTSLLNDGRDCVYCAVVETRGSTPQKAGAVMLVFPDGSQRGTLGGGCVEAEVKQRALDVLQTSKTDILTFTLDDDYGWDDGLICGGRMTMLVDPIQGSSANGVDAKSYYARFREMVEKGKGCTEAVVIKEEAGAPPGSRYLFDGRGELVGRLAPATPPAPVAGQLIPLEKRPAPWVRQGIAYLPVLPRITLLIVGAGHVGQAVGRLAADVDFDVWVLDDRERFANRERFPSGKRLFVGDIGSTLRELGRQGLGQSTYCIIVTRGHAHDEEALYHVIQTDAGYVGMIGSKRKIKLIYEDLVAKGIAPEALERVHAPLGFDIGSQTVPEIAVSIVAELIASRNRGSSDVPARVRVQPENVSS